MIRLFRLHSGLLAGILAGVFAIVLFCVASCEKPVIDTKSYLVERVLLPESLSLTVGDAGSFDVAFLPEDATDGKIVSLESSVPSVLKVSYDGLRVSYEALSAGTSRVSVKVGSVSAFLNVTVEEKEGPVGPVIVKGGYSVEAFPGLRTESELISAASLKVSILEGAQDGNYSVSYSVDGGTALTVRGLFVGDSRTFALDESLPLGRHTYHAEFSEEKDLSEPGSFDGEFWVKGPSLTSAQVRFTSEYDADFLLSPSAVVSLSNGEAGMVQLSYSPVSTYVTREYDVPEFLQLDYSAAQSADGVLSIPFHVLSAGEGTMRVSFINGDETTVVEGAVDGKSLRPLGVKDYNVPQDWKIALGGGSQTYTFTTVPEHAYNPVITEMKSSDENVLTVSWHDLTATVTPHYTGTARISMVLSGIAKAFEVEVTGNVVTDFTVPQGMEVVMGESVTYDVEVTPQGALDAAVEAVSSSDEGILKVSADGFRLTMTGVRQGDASVTVTVGHITKEFGVKVLSDEVSDFKVPENYQLALGGGAQSYTFEVTPAHPSNGSIVSMKSSDESILGVSWSGLTATFTPKYTGTVTVDVTIGSVSKSFPVKVTGDVVTDFTVPQGLEIVMGESVDYEFQVTPVGALDAQIVELKSSDENVLKITYNGLKATLTAGSMGSATVTVKIGGVIKYFTVKVVGKYVTDFEVPSGYQVEYGKSKTYTFVPKPEGAIDAELKEVKSSDSSVLKVEKAGGMVVSFSGVYPGTADVSVTIGSVTKTFKVTVTGLVVTDFTVPSGLEIYKGDSYDYDFKVTPSDAQDASIVSLVSSNEGILKVSYNGLKATFTGAGAGTATVTAKIGMVTKTFTVMVNNKSVTDFEVPSGFEVELGSSKSYTFVVTPAGADDAVINALSSEDETILKVEKAGGLSVNFLPVYPGTSMVTVKIGEVTKSFNVKVTGAVVTDFTVPQDLSIERSKTAEFTVEPSPANASDKVINALSSSAPDIVRVSNQDLKLKFEALKQGSSTISVTVGRRTKTFVVKVTPKLVTDFSVPSGMELEMLTSKTYDIVATPSDADDISIVALRSSDESVLKVSNSGMRLTFQGVTKGSARVTVKVGTVEKSFDVTVTGRYVTDFSVPSGLIVEIGHSESYTFTPTQEGCLDASIVSMSSSDPSVLGVSYNALTGTFEGLYVGTSRVTVKVGGVSKSFDVVVTGTVATGVDIPAEAKDASLTRGTVKEYTIVPTPGDAYDARTIQVTSGSPSVVSVTTLGNYRYSFQALSFGDAKISVSVGRYSTSFMMHVVETVGLERTSGSGAIGWQKSAMYKVLGDNNGYTYSVTGDAKDYVTVSELSNGSIQIFNRNTTPMQKSGTLTVKTSLQGVVASVDFVVDAPDGAVDFQIVSWTVNSSGQPVLRVRAWNGTSTPLTGVEVNGYILSYASVTQTSAVVDVMTNLENGSTSDIYCNYKLSARYFSKYAGEIVSGAGNNVVPAYTVGEFEVIPTSETGDGNGSYLAGFSYYGNIRYRTGGTWYSKHMNY